MNDKPEKHVSRPFSLNMVEQNVLDSTNWQVAASMTATPESSWIRTKTNHPVHFQKGHVFFGTSFTPAPLEIANTKWTSP